MNHVAEGGTEQKEIVAYGRKDDREDSRGKKRKEKKRTFVDIMSLMPGCEI